MTGDEAAALCERYADERKRWAAIDFWERRPEAKRWKMEEGVARDLARLIRAGVVEFTPREKP